jgi:hypothetical protein
VETFSFQDRKCSLFTNDCSLLIARHGGDFDLEVFHTNECAEKILGFWDGVAEWGDAGDVFSWL